MEPSQSKLSSLFDPVQPLPTNSKRLVVTYLSLTELDLVLMKPLIDGLSRFIVRFESQSDLCEAAQALIKYIHNLREIEDDLSVLQEAKAFKEVKTWMPWMPTVGVKLGLRDIPALVIMSYFHAICLATEMYLPQASKAIFNAKRTDVIGEEYNELCRLKDEQDGSEHELEEALDMVVIPLVYAVRHRTQHALETSGAPDL